MNTDLFKRTLAARLEREANEEAKKKEAREAISAAFARAYAILDPYFERLREFVPDLSVNYVPSRIAANTWTISMKIEDISTSLRLDILTNQDANQKHPKYFKLSFGGIDYIEGSDSHDINVVLDAITVFFAENAKNLSL